MAGIFLRTGAKGGGGTMAMLNRNRYFLIIVLVGLLSISVLFLMEERTLFDAVAVSSALKYLDDSPMTSTEADIGEGRASTLPLQNSVLPQKEEQKLLRGRNDKAEHMRNKGLTSSNHGGNYTLRDATDEGVHTVAGLSCENYGGPQDDIAAEMVYWSDIPRDSDHVSPFQFYGPEKKYITFRGIHHIIFQRSRPAAKPTLGVPSTTQRESWHISTGIKFMNTQVTILHIKHPT